MDCPDQGTNKRFLHWLICPLQRLLSWKSDKPPKLLIGQTSYEGILRFGIFFPPYIVIQKRSVKYNINPPDFSIIRRWFLFRFGWRYDVNWKGYIFPTLAIKFNLTNPMDKGY